MVLHYEKSTVNLGLFGEMVVGENTDEIDNIIERWLYYGLQNLTKRKSK